MTRRIGVLAFMCLVALASRQGLGQESVQLLRDDATRASTGVKVAPGTALYFTSGITGNVGDGATMQAQALGAMKRLEANIAIAGSTLEDVVFVRTYLRQTTDGKVDYAGWQAAWQEVFGSRERRPAQTTVGVPRANENGSLVEIEFISAARDAAKMADASAGQGLPSANAKVKPFGAKDARILAGAGVMPDSGFYWTAGLTAPVLDRTAAPTSYASRGTMETQARNTLQALKDNIAGAGLSLSDVVYVRAWLGPDINNGGKFDTEAWNKAYGEFFNNPAQPHKPARVTMTTPTFAGNTGGPSNTMIEIEFVAAFPDAAPAIFAKAEGADATTRLYGAPTALFASGVAGKPGTSLFLSSGMLPGVTGDMKTQATAALEALGRTLTQAGGSFKDVTFLRAYIVPEADGSVDRAGWNEAYSRFFNTPAQPRKPGRVTIPVVSLPSSTARIALDAIAVIP